MSQKGIHVDFIPLDPKHISCAPLIKMYRTFNRMFNSLHFKFN